MVGIITQSTSLNSFFSISFCVLALALHSYAAYLAAARYREASGRAWPGPASKGGTPSEVSAYLGMLVLSCLLLPFFAVCSLVRVGNLANDGVKLGRDHALNPNLDACCRKVKNSTVRRIWRNGLPLAQTLFLTSSFLLLLPETLLTAAEVDYGYKTSDSVWSSDVDFLFGEVRAHHSDVVASINLTQARQTLASTSNGNGSGSLLPTVRPPTATGGWGADHSVSLAFVNFVLALLVFSVRYASVFWYTNKALTLVFSLQLLAMTVTSILGYSALCLLYKVCHNHTLYINVHLSLGCGASLALYILGSLVMIFSTVTVFEYGAHYFAEKLRIVERKHQGGEKWVKKTVVVRSGCQGYLPHSCAMGALVGLAVLKGPLMYDLVCVYRPTQDGLVLAGLVSEALYMVLWIALWCGLTVKQRWQFRILDYVPLGKPLFTIHDSHHVLNNPAALGGSDHRRRSSGSGGCSGGGGDGGSSQCLELQEAPRGAVGGGGARRGHSRESPPGYLEALSNSGSGDVTPDHEVTHSEAGTEESDQLNDIVDPFPSGGGARRKVRPGGAGGRRHHSGQRVVTFQDSAQQQRGSRRHSAGDLGGSNGDVSAHPQPSTSSSRHLNVKVDVHDNVRGGNHYNSSNNRQHHSPTTTTPTPAIINGVGYHGDANTSGEAPSALATAAGGVTRRPRSEQHSDANTLTREYRNSLRSKCDDLYAVVDPQPLRSRSGSLGHLPHRDHDVIDDDVVVGEEEGVSSAPSDPLPTLMSSFRDKLRESSRTASTLREQRRHLQLGHYGGERGDGPQPVVNGVGGGECDGVASDRRRPYAATEADPADITLRLDDSLDSGVRGSSKQGSSLSDDDRNSNGSSYIPPHPHTHPHHHRPPYNNPHHLHPHHLNNNHSHTSSPVNSTFESDSGILPSIRENGQPCGSGGGSGAGSVSSDKPPRQQGGGSKMDYLSIDKAGGVGVQGGGYSSSRHLNIVPRTKAEIGRRDSANYSLTSSQETSSNDSDHGHGLCSQV